MKQHEEMELAPSSSELAQIAVFGSAGAPANRYSTFVQRLRNTGWYYSVKIDTSGTFQTEVSVHSDI
jgi:hypothetical protein